MLDKPPQRKTLRPSPPYASTSNMPGLTSVLSDYIKTVFQCLVNYETIKCKKIVSMCVRLKLNTSIRDWAAVWLFWDFLIGRMLLFWFSFPWLFALHCWSVWFFEFRIACKMSLASAIILSLIWWFFLLMSSWRCLSVSASWTNLGFYLHRVVIIVASNVSVVGYNPVNVIHSFEIFVILNCNYEWLPMNFYVK